jgi:membrane protein implicated in regulation of membrane protease activity
MEFVSRLPFLLGGVMALIVGVIARLYGTDQSDIYIRMTVSMLVFYILGVYARSTINRIIDEVERKKEEERIIKEEKERQERETARIKAEEEAKGGKVDHRVGEFEEEFSPLRVSEYMNSDNLQK